MGIKITDMTPAASVAGTELIPASKAGAPRSVTPAQVKDYVVAQLQAIAAGGSVAAGNGLYALQGGVLKPVDIDLVCQRSLDTMWAKANAVPVGANVLPLKAAGVEKTVTLTALAEAVRGLIEAAVLDVSDLASGSGTLAVTDYMLVTQGTTAKKITVQNLYDAIYTGLAAHVAAQANQAAPAAGDLLYLVRGATPYKVTLANLAAYTATLALLDGSGTAGFLTSWTDANTLQAGPSVATSFAVGSDVELPTSKAVRDVMNTLINDFSDIGAALADGDLAVVYDLSATTQRKSAVSRFWDYVQAKIVAAGIPITTQTDIGAALADADEFLVYDASAVANRKSAISRITTYLQTALTTLASLVLTGKLTSYNGIATEGWGLGAIRKSLRTVGLLADALPFLSFTPGADATFLVSANVNVTGLLSGTIVVGVDYFDETNTEQTNYLQFVAPGYPSSIVSVVPVTAGKAYAGMPLRVRVKSGTLFKIFVTGTGGGFTGVYNLDADVTQVG